MLQGRDEAPQHWVFPATTAEVRPVEDVASRARKGEILDGAIVSMVFRDDVFDRRRRQGLVLRRDVVTPSEVDPLAREHPLSGMVDPSLFEGVVGGGRPEQETVCFGSVHGVWALFTA